MDRKDLFAIVILMGVLGTAYYIGDTMGPIIGVIVTGILVIAYMKMSDSMFPLPEEKGEL